MLWDTHSNNAHVCMALWHLHSLRPSGSSKEVHMPHGLSLTHTHTALLHGTLRLHLYGLVHPNAPPLCMVHLAGLQRLVKEAPQNCHCSLAAVSCQVMPLCVGASDVCHGTLEWTTDCWLSVLLGTPPLLGVH